MSRLHAIHLLTPDVTRQRAWYGAQLGLEPADAPDTFATRGAALSLREHASAGIELVIAVRGLEPRLSALDSRGIEVAREAGGREATLADPDGNRLRLVEEGAPAAGKWPLLSHVIVNTGDLSRSGHFYRDALGFKVADDTGAFLELESGECRLMLHDQADPLGVALHADQRVAFALSDEDLDEWAEELRGKGVSFVTAPMDEELGRVAEVEDADGWFVVLRGPGTDIGRAEELAAEYEDKGGTHTGSGRRTLEAGEMSQRPGFGSRKPVKRRIERVATKGFEQLERGRDDAKGGDLPSLPRTGPTGGPRPSFTGPRPAFPGPRPGFTGPRPGPSGPSGPRTDRPGPSGPRPGFSGSRPTGPPGTRPSHAGPPRPPGPRPSAAPPRAPGASRPALGDGRTQRPREAPRRPEAPREADSDRDGE